MGDVSQPIGGHHNNTKNSEAFDELKDDPGLRRSMRKSAGVPVQ